MKRKFNSLKMDKKTIAKLNEKQLNAVKGGKGSVDAPSQPGTSANMPLCTTSCN